MNIKVHGNIVLIEEPIITIEQCEEVSNIIKEIAKNHDSIVIDVKNSFSFPSSVISVLEKLRDEGKKITIKVREPILYELFKDLNLDKTFTLIKE